MIRESEEIENGKKSQVAGHNQSTSDIKQREDKYQKEELEMRVEQMPIARRAVLPSLAPL